MRTSYSKIPLFVFILALNSQSVRADTASFTSNVNYCGFLNVGFTEDTKNRANFSGSPSQLQAHCSAKKNFVLLELDSIAQCADVHVQAINTSGNQTFYNISVQTTPNPSELVAGKERLMGDHNIAFCLVTDTDKASLFSEIAPDAELMAAVYEAANREIGELLKNNPNADVSTAFPSFYDAPPGIALRNKDRTTEIHSPHLLLTNQLKVFRSNSGTEIITVNLGFVTAIMLRKDQKELIRAGFFLGWPMGVSSAAHSDRLEILYRVNYPDSWELIIDKFEFDTVDAARPIDNALVWISDSFDMPTAFEYDPAMISEAVLRKYTKIRPSYDYNASQRCVTSQHPYAVPNVDTQRLAERIAEYRESVPVELNACQAYIEELEGHTEIEALQPLVDQRKQRTRFILWREEVIFEFSQSWDISLLRNQTWISDPEAISRIE